MKSGSEHATNTLPSTGLMAALTRMTQPRRKACLTALGMQKELLYLPSQGTVLAPLNLQEQSQYFIALTLNWWANCLSSRLYFVQVLTFFFFFLLPVLTFC